MTDVANLQLDQIVIQTRSLFGFQRDVVQSSVLLGGGSEHQTEEDNVGFPELYLDELNPVVEVEGAGDSQVVGLCP